jgi:hypothetical protein
LAANGRYRAGKSQTATTAIGLMPTAIGLMPTANDVVQFDI